LLTANILNINILDKPVLHAIQSVLLFMSRWNAASKIKLAKCKM